MIRRELLKTTGPLVALPSFPTLLMPRSRGDLHDMDPGRIVEEYRRRKLAGLSDAALARQVGEVVSIPCEGIISFTLHAPLELLARQALLPLVAGSGREAARIQMVASAAIYESGTRPVRGSKPQLLGDDALLGEILQASLKDGAVDTVEAAAMRLGEREGL
jgi:hypothetical protein